MNTPMKFLFLFLFSITMLSCSSDSDDMSSGSDPDPDPDPQPDVNPIPDKTSTYAADVQVIMASNCTSCHSNPPSQGAPMSLETFQEVVNAVNNRDLFGRISTMNANNVMPQSGRLPNATILLVEDWIADGLQEQ